MAQGGFGYSIEITVNAQLVAVAELQDGSGIPKVKKILKEITGHDAPGGYRQMIDTGKRTVEPFPIIVPYDGTETTHAALVANFNGTTALACKVKDPSGAEIMSGDAFITELGFDPPQEGAYMLNANCEPTGEWVPAAGSGS